MAARLARPAAFATRSVTARAASRLSLPGFTTVTPAIAARSPRLFAKASSSPFSFTPAMSFQSSAPAAVKAGDAIPSLEVLVEDSPGNKVNLADEFKKGNGIIIGVPGAFSTACSAKHVPSYINHPKIKQAGQVFVVSVNDAFVMKAWGDDLDPKKASGIRFLGDPAGEFTRALDLEFDASPFFGNPRSKRYALVIEDGKVKSTHIEPDNTGTSVSLADNVFASQDW